ncbi:MAG: hypothetical protein ACWA5W_00185 [Phycisphaerales bacterium]
MDDRQAGIKEGAGLEDSRVNQEFLDFLNKWSTPVILVLAVAALMWAGLQKLERMKIARVDQAFRELAATTQGGNPSPSSLTTLADEYEGVRSVSEMALLTATDLYLNAFVTGVEPGAERDRSGAVVNDSDILDKDQRQAYLDKAAQTANKVLELSSSVEGKELIAMQAMSRLAAIAEGNRDFDGAKATYEQLKAKAESSGFQVVANFASGRIDQLALLKDVKELPSQDLIAPLPGEEAQPQLTQEQIQEMLNNIQNQTPEVESDAVDDGSVDVDGDLPETPAETPTEEPAEEPESP